MILNNKDVSSTKYIIKSHTSKNLIMHPIRRSISLGVWTQINGNIDTGITDTMKSHIQWNNWRQYYL
jgi:hypothetical protein